MIRFLRDLVAWLKHGKQGRRKPEVLVISSIEPGCRLILDGKECQPFVGYESGLAVASTTGFVVGDIVMPSHGQSPLRKAWDWWGLK